MINGKRVLVYIPARSGSKSIKDKNIVYVCGKPLIAYTIEAAKGSKYVDRIIVSTDSLKYAEIVKQFGAEAPFLRPAELATDEVEEIHTSLHLISWVETNPEDKYDFIVKLEPTSPLRLPEDVDKAIETLEQKDADVVVSVTEAVTHPFWMNTLPPDHSMNGFIDLSIARKNRQELPLYYQLDGIVSAAKVDFIKSKKMWFSESNGFAVITPGERAVDVDGPEQLELVKILIRKRMEKQDESKCRETI